MKTDLFQSYGHCWVFQICWHIECSTFTTSSRIWNSSTGIPSPPLALFIEMFPKAHLTSHSRISGSRWVITPSWLSGSWRFFCIGSEPLLLKYLIPHSLSYGFQATSSIPFKVHLKGVCVFVYVEGEGRRKRNREKCWRNKVLWCDYLSPSPTSISFKIYCWNLSSRCNSI